MCGYRQSGDSSELAPGLPCKGKSLRNRGVSQIMLFLVIPRSLLRGGFIRLWRSAKLATSYFVVIDHDRDTPHPALRVGTIQEGQQVTKYGIGFPRAEAMEELPGSEIEGASQGVFFVLPWRHDFL